MLRARRTLERSRLDRRVRLTVLDGLRPFGGHCGTLAQATALVSDTTVARNGQVGHVEVSDTSSIRR
jgi:hypothetical protein